MAATLRHLGLKATGGNYTLAKVRIRKLGLTTNHWLGQAIHKGMTNRVSSSNAIDLATVLVADSLYVGSSNLKRRLLKAGLLTPECYECGLQQWRGRPISLQLDHKNGKNDDHSLVNLRLMCPNCHSQTDTFAGRNKTKSQATKCPDCKGRKDKGSARCHPCSITKRCRERDLNPHATRDTQV